MNFYKHFSCIMYILTLHSNTAIADKNYQLNVLKTDVEDVSSSAAGLVLHIEVENTSNDEDYEVEVKPDDCCLKVGAEEDCDAMEIIGDCVDVIPKGTTKKLKIVAPLIDPYQRYGYCTIYLDSKSKKRQLKAMRNKIKIPFNTRVANKKQKMESAEGIKLCDEIDQDPLNDCKPVDCETYYNGRRSYFDSKTKRCVKVPICVPNAEMTNVILDVRNNGCVNEETITEDDIKAIKDISNNEEKHSKDIIIVNNKPLKEENGNFEKFQNKTIKDKTDKGLRERRGISNLNVFRNKAYNLLFTRYLVTTKCTIIVLLSVILLQCCLICMLICFVKKTCRNCTKTTLIRSLFNYRQDASVTTPLIGTSDADTETTLFEYVNEGSRIDKRVKCYKACQKELDNNSKTSISDDILSKCIKRRDWKTTRKSEPIENVPENNIVADNNETKLDIPSKDGRKKSNVTVNFETVYSDEKKNKKMEDQRIVKNLESKTIQTAIESKYEVTQCEFSEKEIKCHSYNLTDEKSAQAEFSNDSIDDFLSERGLIYLAGEDMSKYSLSTGSIMRPTSTTSEFSSKTSKNNIVKNLLSLLHKKSKHRPSSEPGVKRRRRM